MVGRRRYLRERAEFRKLLRTSKPDLVHFHGYRPDVVDSGVARSEHIPVVSTAHGFFDHGLKIRLYEMLQRLSFRRFDAVIAVSGAIYDRLVAAGVSKEKTHHVQNAIHVPTVSYEREEARSRLGIDSDAFIVGWVGRLSFEKGSDTFINAVERIRDLRVQAVLIGEGPDRTDLEASVEKMSLGDSVRFLGEIPSAVNYFKAFDMFVLSSRTEGTPIVLLEAVANGVPVVATDVGGVRELVTEDEALLVECDDVVGIANAIREVIKNRGLADQRAQNALDRMSQDSSARTWLERYENIYQHVCGCRSI